jgi:hypothetical protein
VWNLIEGDVGIEGMDIGVCGLLRSDAMARSARRALHRDHSSAAVPRRRQAFANCFTPAREGTVCFRTLDSRR